MRSKAPQHGPAVATKAEAPDCLAQQGGACREMAAAAALALGIEAEWRKRAMGVVPAQQKARPEGQRPIPVTFTSMLVMDSGARLFPVAQLRPDRTRPYGARPNRQGGLPSSSIPLNTL